MSKSKTYTLTPDWKYFLPAYLISVLTFPLIIGIAAFYFVRKYHKSIRYIITDKQIKVSNSKYQQNIDLVNIREIEVEQDWLQQKMGIGSLVIHTAATKMPVGGIERPKEFKEFIGQAVQSLQKQAKPRTRKKVREPEYGPGSMEKINYLTGLWQQGLITDEEFEQERKHYK